MGMTPEQIEKRDNLLDMIQNRVPVAEMVTKTGYSAMTVYRYVKRIYGTTAEYPGFEKHYDATHKRETLCWKCQKAVLGCSWARNYKPIPGWEAEKTKIRNNPYVPEIWIESYCVIKCPEYEKDSPKPGKNWWKYG